jgi:vanillate O-demethylase ferredoxin subunit
MNAELTLRVRAKRTEALDICSYELVRDDGAPLPAFTAGAHVDVQVPGGLVRQYSLCSDPADNSHYRIAVLRDAASRGGSVAMHERVHEGDLLGISLPRNHFPLSADALHHLLLAGGIGVTPILSMAQTLHAKGTSFAMHYCTRSAERTAFAEALRKATFASRVQFHHDDGVDAQKLNIDALLAAASPDTHLYVCGPKGFMDAVLGKARSSGWSESRLHFEFFAGEVTHSADEAVFEVRIASTGQTIAVPTGQTVVKALEAAGVCIQTSCEQGVCGTCLTRVLEGTPDHKDMYLTPEEQAANDQFLPCCSRAKTPVLVLDL